MDSLTSPMEDKITIFVRLLDRDDKDQPEPFHLDSKANWNFVELLVRLTS